MVVVRQALVILVTGTLGYSGAAFGQQASAPNDPPGRVGRLAFTQGTVSFHDAERTDWEPAAINMPLTTGDAVWTEPDSHAEISIAGTRVRMDGATQVDMLTLDDRSTRLQVDQGRVDIKTFAYDARQPYDLVTPRGTATLQQQGDYYVEAGSTQDPTRLGVRAGAAQFQAPDGRVLAVRAGEVAEITGDGSSMELHTIQSPPPPMPQYWAARDKQVVYDQPPQYLSAGVTGYEDLNYYGTWQNDPEYGQVWYVRDVPSGWSPYTTGRWDYQPVYGWTWIDEQPWGFAPYHYGRWAQRNNRWFWVPPERSRPAVYAPALVAFVGGTELGLALGAQNRQPVGWFPLGPREAYVPPYTTNRDYYRRLNYSARVQDRILDDRWQRAQRHEAVAQQQNWMNRRFTTVVPAETFARSQPVQRAAIRVSADKIATAPVAAVAAPPQPTQSIRALMAAPNTAPRPSTPAAPTAPNQVGAGTQANVAALAAIKPELQAQKAPGPQIMSRSAMTTNTSATAGTDAKAALPKLEPRNASAPPLPQIQGERKPVTLQAGPQQATAPANQPANRPGVPPLPGEPNRAQPGQPGLPPTRDRNEARPEPPRPGQPPQANTQPNAAMPSAQPPKPQAAPTQQAAPQPPKAEPPRPPQAQTAPQAPKPPQAMNAPQPPQHQPAPPQQPQATPPAPQPQQQLMRQPSAPPPQQQTHAAPPPQPQRQAAPPPQMQQHAPTPPPQQTHAPAPPPQPQRQAAPPPPQPQRQAAPPPPPRPAAPPPQQAQQAPHPQPAPQPQAKPQQPPPPQGQHKPDEKK